jgi:rhodanese-related sulfurtransferase
MKFDNLSKGIIHYQRSIVIMLCLSLLGVGSLSIAAMVNHMDIPTLIVSWSAKQVSVNQLQKGQLKPVILIDVRSPEEYTEDHIGESQLVPLDDIKAGFGIKEIRTIIKTKPQNPTQPTLVLYCGSGQRSVKAYKQLENTGLNFVVLKGGIKAWRKVVPRSKDAEVLAPIMLLR